MNYPYSPAGPEGQHFGMENWVRFWATVPEGTKNIIRATRDREARYDTEFYVWRDYKELAEAWAIKEGLM